MLRRDFIKISGATLASAPLTSVPLHFNAAPQLNIKKSLKYSMVDAPGSVLDHFRMLKEVGFDGVEMDSPSDINIDEVLEAKEETGLEIPGVINSAHWKMPLSDPDASVRAKCVEASKTALQDCKRYGGTTMLLVPGVVNDKISYADAYRRSQEEIRKLLPVAEETGVKIAIENVWNNMLISPLEAARFIDEFENSMIGWYFDVGNIVRYGWPEHWIEALGDRIMKLDIKEYSRKKQQDEGIWKGFDVELMEGDCNWPKVNKALDKIGYEGWASAEVKGGDRDRLQTISQKMDAIFGLA
ncbi:sugar phosphate isomerase/epimerase family protein [Tunicatimonas pelagia]|uniref:sugar phosphate isomerase/epimerase family protein n=1 Tax=Tunicatimonas pelagia TaxID=931531 RepID=UPI0026668DE6|nr:sugar phosphate isomerase/epimerase family protein [Tunicatimonas pelagia]WKN41658.1 sugar phosphate isomerase/epimerase [Tunicatimonas pelagia]